MSNFKENILKFAYQLGGQIHLKSIRDGILLVVPLIMIGSMFLILAFAPIPGYADMMANIFGANWQKVLLYPVGVSFDLMAIFVVIGISYYLALNRGIDVLPAVSISLVAFFLITPFEIKEVFNNQLVELKGIPLQYMGSKGIFAAVIVSITATEMLAWFVKNKFSFKMPDSVPNAIKQVFESLIAFFIIIIFFLIIKVSIGATSFENLHLVVGEFLQKPLSAVTDSFIGAIVTPLILTFLWLLGIHGSALILAGILAPMLNIALDENRIAFMNGDVIPNIITPQFYDLFVQIGGSGMTLGLAFMLVFLSKSTHLKQIGKLSIIPAIFNINEPILFGLPIVTNPILAIPFVLSATLSSMITYGAFYLGFVPKLIGIAIPWTTPTLISGYLVTGGSVAGVVLQMLLICMTTAIYYPFFKYFDKQKYLEEHNFIKP